MLPTNNSILDYLTQSDKDLIKDFLETFYIVTEVPAPFIAKVILEKDIYLHYKKHMWDTLRKSPVLKEQFLKYMLVLYPFLKPKNMTSRRGGAKWAYLNISLKHENNF